MVSGILFVQHATPETIIQLHDQLSNELPNLKGKWNFTFKIFRNNPYSVDPSSTTTSAPESDTKFLYTLSTSYLAGNTISLINKKSVGIFSHIVDEEADESTDPRSCIPSELINRGATNGLNDKFDLFVGMKLQSLWTQRQTIKGDGGQIYELENGNLIIRTSNVFLHGIFKGLLVQIEINGVNSTGMSREDMIQNVAAKHNISVDTLRCNVLDENLLDPYGDLSLQYASILNF